MESPTAASAELEPVDEPEVLRPGQSPAEPPPEPEVRAPLLARAGSAALMGAAGVFLGLLGLLLSLSIVFIWIGLPLLLAGLGLVVAAVFTLLGGGRIVVRRF